MKLILDISKQGGRLEIYSIRNTLYIRPSGIINPILIKEDLKAAMIFGLMNPKGWEYIVDTSNVLFPNPVNLFYLKKIKDLPNLNNYIIFSPDPKVRFLASLTNFIIRPDIVLVDQKKLDELLV
jgi:hypothetical protein